MQQRLQSAALCTTGRAHSYLPVAAGQSAACLHCYFVFPVWRVARADVELDTVCHRPYAAPVVHADRCLWYHSAHKQ
jgi:hypothetical protein